MNDELEIIEEFNSAKVKEFQETGNPEIIVQVIEKNKGLVHSIVNWYCRDKTIYDDAVQEGIFALIKAMKEYKFDKSVKFVTFATNIIKNQVLSCLYQRYKIGGYNVSAIKNFVKIRKIDRQHINQNINLTDEQLAKVSGFPLKKIKYYRNFLKGTLALDYEYGEGRSDTESSLLATLVDSRSTNFENYVLDRIFFIDCLKKFKNILNEREYKTIYLRNGFNGDKPKTLKEVGKQLNLSYEMIRRIEKKAQTKLRKEFSRDCFRY